MIQHTTNNSKPFSRIVSMPWMICLIYVLRIKHQFYCPRFPHHQTKDQVTTRVRPVLSTVFFTRFTFGADILSCTPSFFPSDLRPRCMRQSSVHPCPCQGFLKLLATQAPLEREQSRQGSPEPQIQQNGASRSQSQHIAQPGNCVYFTVVPP